MDTGEISSLTFSPDGAWLEASGDGIAQLWSLNFDYLTEIACQFVGRNFTHAEWTQYFPHEEYRKTCEQWPLEPEVTATAAP